MTYILNCFPFRVKQSAKVRFFFGSRKDAKNAKKIFNRVAFYKYYLALFEPLRDNLIFMMVQESLDFLGGRFLERFLVEEYLL